MGNQDSIINQAGQTTSGEFPESNGRAEGSPQLTPIAMPPSGPDVFPDFAVSPEEVTRRTRMLQDYVRQHMTEGEDYGIMPGGNKPTLFKPGAEKLNAVYGLSPIVEVTNRMEDWTDGFVAYEVKVTLLNKRTGQIEAEGIGSCNSRERRYKNQDAAGSANTVLKMAKKRALVDATLSATRASGMFTQDLEDIEFEAPRSYGDRNADQRQERVVEGGGRPRTSQPATRGETASTVNRDQSTEKQHGRIRASAARVFGRPQSEEKLLELERRPLESLTKVEASALIDRLEAMEPRSQENRPPAYQR